MFKLLSRKTSPEWILEGDIKGCFDNISHDWMLENIPSDKRIMRQFLRCGYVENKRLFPTTEGSPQGGLISPTYANMTLDGLERLLLERYSTSSTGHYHPNYNKHKVHLCRYADDCAPRRRKLVTWCQTSIAMLCEWWWQAHRNRYIGGGFKSLWGAVVKSYGTERQRKGCTKQSGVDSGDERSCEPLTKTSKA